jgi:hypothetical protein
MKTKLIACAMLLASFAQAQTSQPTRLNLGAAFGFVNPLGISDDIYVDYGIGSRFMVEAEKGISKKGALQTGLQLNITSIAMDAMINTGNKLITAPPNLKYARINQTSLQIPLRYRYYRQESKDGRFYQFGATLGYVIINTYLYREKGNEKEQDITGVNPTQLALHAGLGRRFNTKHVFYMDWSINVTRYFKQQDASNIYPLQLCFGVLL